MMMKVIAYFILILLFKNLNAQINPLWDELIIGNLHPEDTLIVNVSPVGFIFTGDKSYRPKSIYDTGYHNFGGIKKLFYMPSNFENKHFRLNHDAALSPNSCDSNIGYGKYKIEFSKWDWDSITYEYTLFRIDSLVIDFSDADYGYSGIWSSFTNDFLVYYWGEDSIFVEFYGGSKIKLDTTDRDFQMWNQEGRGTFKTQNKSGFKSDSNHLNYPIISENYSSINHLYPGDINLNLQIEHDVSTNIATDITVKSKSFVKIYNGKTLTMSAPPSGYSNLIVTDSSFFAVRPSAKIIVHSPNRITLKNTGLIVINTGGEIRIKPGAFFCNEGGKLYGRITFENGIHQPLCNQLTDFFMQDSSKFVLDSNAILPIPDNTTLHLRGIESALILNPGSKLLFGENSGIICDSGAKVIANYAEFASIDSTKKWNGISLNDLSHDTIKNCVIKNAMYGIAISDKHTEEEEFQDFNSTEISNCSFINQTNYVLNNAVYAEGSSEILIKNNTIQSNVITKGFTHGIYAEYCPAGNFSVIGNTISNTGTGITLISCSPFVVQNNIEGNEYGESGFFLDNVTGKRNAERGVLL